MTDTWRGHPIQLYRGIWSYSDTLQPVADAPVRKCGACGQDQTPEGHDPCLGTLPGVMNACCGHGEQNQCWVQLLDGTTIRGEDAVRWIEQRLSMREVDVV